MGLPAWTREATPTLLTEARGGFPAFPGGVQRAPKASGQSEREVPDGVRHSPPEAPTGRPGLLPGTRGTRVRGPGRPRRGSAEFPRACPKRTQPEAVQDLPGRPEASGGPRISRPRGSSGLPGRVPGQPQLPGEVSEAPQRSRQELVSRETWPEAPAPAPGPNPGGQAEPGPRQRDGGWRRSCRKSVPTPAGRRRARARGIRPLNSTQPRSTRRPRLS